MYIFSTQDIAQQIEILLGIQRSGSIYHIKTHRKVYLENKLGKSKLFMKAKKKENKKRKSLCNL